MANDTDFEVFISYRRSSGGSEAHAIRLALAQRLVRAFQDVEGLDSGTFDEALLRRVETAVAVLIVLSPGALKLCGSPEDWLRREIVHAIESKRTIVPVTLPGFELPEVESLPADVQPLLRYHSVKYVHEQFDGTIDQIVKRLKLAPPPDKEVFVDFAPADSDSAARVVDVLHSSGVTVWPDPSRLRGEPRTRLEAGRACRNAKLVVVVWSRAAIHHREIRHQLLSTWLLGKPYLILTIDRTLTREALDYWQSPLDVIDMSGSPEGWSEKVLACLRSMGVTYEGARHAMRVGKADGIGFETLRSMARLSASLKVLPAMRALGVRTDAQQTFRLGARVQVCLDLPRESHVVLLDQGPDGKVYCLCPSAFAPHSTLPAGPNYLPLEESPRPYFELSGPAEGREHLVAVISETPLALDWRPGPGQLARVLGEAELQKLIDSLRAQPDERWDIAAHYFDITA